VATKRKPTARPARDQRAERWDGASLPGRNPIHAVALSPDERRLLVLAERQVPRKQLKGTTSSSVLEIWSAGATAPDRVLAVPGPRGNGALGRVVEGDAVTRTFYVAK
jgi:hypothetical protein